MKKFMDEPLKLIRAAQWCTSKNEEQLALNKSFKKDLIKWSIAHEFFSLLSRLLALTSATQWNETISKVGFIFSKLRIRFQKWFEKKMNMMSLFSTLIMQSHRQMTMRLSYWTTPSVQGEKTNRKLTYDLLISSKANLNFFLDTVVIR